jgi:leader peptidase (prepilin peptidase)/N-methyltransferase
VSRFVASLAVRPHLAVIAGAAFALMVTSAAVVDGGERLAPSAILALGLAWGSAIDLERMRLPDAITLPLIVTGLAFAYVGGPQVLLDAAIGCGVGYAAGRTLSELFWRLRKREGLGLGDVKLLAAAGAWLSWRGLPFAVLAASIVALAVVLGLALIGKIDLKASPKVPFGPFLALGIWIAWLAAPV